LRSLERNDARNETGPEHGPELPPSDAKIAAEPDRFNTSSGPASCNSRG